MALALSFLWACSPEGKRPGSGRAGVPEEIAPVFADAPPFVSRAWSLSPLRPASREAELQILLFASGSPAFAAMVMPAPRLPFVEPWVDDISLTRTNARADLSASLSAPRGWKAVPLDISVPVILLRTDLWRKNGLAEPATPSSFREDLDRLKKSGEETGGVVTSSLPWEALFWSLAWSEEGGFSTDLYTPEKVRVLTWLVAQDIGAKGEGKKGPVEAFISGRSAAAMRSFLREGRKGDVSVMSLPAVSGARAPNLGWCLVRAKGTQETPGAWDQWAAPAFCRWASARGFQPAFSSAGTADDITSAVAHTALLPQEIPARLVVIAEDAIDDAANGAATAAEALRRAQARWQAQAHE